MQNLSKTETESAPPLPPKPRTKMSSKTLKKMNGENDEKSEEKKEEKQLAEESVRERGEDHLKDSPKSPKDSSKEDSSEKETEEVQEEGRRGKINPLMYLKKLKFLGKKDSGIEVEEIVNEDEEIPHKTSSEISQINVLILGETLVGE